MRQLVLALLLMTAWIGGALPVVAGGGEVWEFVGYHRPGETVESTTSVSWGHNADLGRPEDGPYLIYLAPANTEEQGLLVGIVEVYESPYQRPNGVPYGPHQAVARFEIPDVPPGDYQVLHCNEPCTTTLGDIVGSWGLRIVGGGDGRPADEIAVEVRDRLADAPLTIPSPESGTEPMSFEALWATVVASIGVLLVIRMLRNEPTLSQ
jgi:hypothetical protein